MYRWFRNTFFSLNFINNTNSSKSFKYIDINCNNLNTNYTKTNLNDQDEDDDDDDDKNNTNKCNFNTKNSKTKTKHKTSNSFTDSSTSNQFAVGRKAKKAKRIDKQQVNNSNEYVTNGLELNKFYKLNLDNEPLSNDIYQSLAKFMNKQFCKNLKQKQRPFKKQNCKLNNKLNLFDLNATCLTPLTPDNTPSPSSSSGSSTTVVKSIIETDKNNNLNEKPTTLNFRPNSCSSLSDALKSCNSPADSQNRSRNNSYTIFSNLDTSSNSSRPESILNASNNLLDLSFLTRILLNTFRMQAIGVVFLILII